jgi:immunity protein 27 of polymorphic toxin system
MRRLEPWETSLVGEWELVDGKVVGNEAEQRIGLLLATGYLQEVASRDSGWTTLYRDPDDGRLWELTYPHSGMHGGGPKQLEVIDGAEAARLYKL